MTLNRMPFAGLCLLLSIFWTPDCRSSEVSSGDGPLCALFMSTADPQLIEAANKIEELPIEEQADIIERIEAEGFNVREILGALSVTRKSADPVYQVANERFIDPSVYRVTRGHKIEMFVEVPLDGVSRHQSAFFQRLVESDSTLIGLDLQSNDIRRLQLKAGTIPLRENKNPEEGAHNVIQITGVSGLLRLMKENPDHPGFIYGEEVKDQLRAAISTKYGYKLISGVVKESPGYANEGVLTLEDGTEIEMCNIRMLNIVGIDRASFFNRGEDELYIGRRVRVWSQRGLKWVTARIVSPDPAHGLVEVIADEQLHENMNFHNGRGLSVGGKSFDLDLRDPEIYPEKNHPLQNYSHIQSGAIVKFKTKSGETNYGYIDNIVSAKNFYEVKDTRDEWPKLSFDDPVEVLGLNATPSEQPLVKRHNRISLFDFRTQREQVFEILAYDPSDRIIVAAIVSLRPRGTALVSLFRLGDSRLKFIGNDNSEVFREHPLLGEIQKYGFANYRIEFYDDQGQMRTGQILSRETLPAFVEVIIERRPDQRDSSDDHYFRFNVVPSKIIRVLRP